MSDILDLPAGPLAAASLALARSAASGPIVGHSIRSFLFARWLAGHEGCVDDAGYDEDLLFAATVMHDLGLGERARGAARFEVEGADLAAALLREHEVAESDVQRVWEAIALHSSIGLAERRGLLTCLTHKGVFVDVGPLGHTVPEEFSREVLDAYPQPGGGAYIADAIIAHASRSPAAAPPGSLAAYLLLQRRGGLRDDLIVARAHPNHALKSRVRSMQAGGTRSWTVNAPRRLKYSGTCGAVRSRASRISSSAPGRPASG